MIHKISIIKLLLFFSLFILSYEQFQQQCTLGKNCPFNQGICVSNFCRCYEGYVTLNDVSLPPEKQIYCNYQQKSQYTPIILEIFLPCIGHFVVGNYWIGLLKFSLILSFILSSLSLYGEIRIPPLLIILFNKLGLSSILSKEDNKKEEEEEPEPRSRFRGRKNSDSDFPLAMEEKVEGEKTDNDNEAPKYKVARQAYDEGEEPENQEKLIPRPDFIQSDFADLQAPYDSGLILCNPPYGERLSDEEQVAELYKKMSSLWNDFPDWNMGIITSNESFQNNFGHNATSLKPLKSGNLDTCLYIYDRTKPEPQNQKDLTYRKSYKKQD